MFDFIVVAIIVVAFWGAITIAGYLIGDSKAVGWTGFWLCLLFGPMGLYAIIIIACMRPEVAEHQTSWMRSLRWMGFTAADRKTLDSTSEEQTLIRQVLAEKNNLDGEPTSEQPAPASESEQPISQEAADAGKWLAEQEQKATVTVHSPQQREATESAWSEQYRLQCMQRKTEADLKAAADLKEREAALQFGVEYAEQAIAAGRVDRRKAGRNIRQFLQHGLRHHSLDETLTPGDLALARTLWQEHVAEN